MLLRFLAVFFFLFNLAVAGFSRPEYVPGRLLNYRVVKNFEAQELKDFFKTHHIPRLVLPVNMGLKVYEVIYTTTYIDSSVIKASGLLYVPQTNNLKLPLMVYNHGTEVCRERSASFTDEQTIGLAFAADGYIVMTPDYIGLGEGDHSQLYLNAHAEAQATVDMLLAAKDLLALLDVNTSDKLFVAGYSQGGHAAMATARLLQSNYADRFKVTAAAPMSGPYDLENTVYEGRRKEYVYPGFLMMLLKSYLDSEGQYNRLNTLLVSPYDTVVPPLLNGEYPLAEIDKVLPDTIFKAVNPVFYTDFENNPNSPFRVFLRNNNVYDWKPEMPMKLCYCDGDEEVTYQNSITAYNTMKQNGSKTVHLWRAGKKFGHVNCALFAVVYTKMFFDGFRNGRPGSNGPHFKRLLINIGKLAVSP